MKVTIAQLNPVVGDIDGNQEKMENALRQCAGDKPDLVVFSELFITGYPPRDLLERPSFIDKVKSSIDEIIQFSLQFPDTGILFGAPVSTGKETGRGLYNAALLIYQGSVIFEQYKSLLPAYDVFDEVRYFDSSPEIDVIQFKDEVLGIAVCEDSWNNAGMWSRRQYDFDPMEKLAEKGATIFINISASPFHRGKEEIRFSIIQSHAEKHRKPFLFVNQVGGNDELVFDGRSFCVDSKGEALSVCTSFMESIRTIDLKGASLQRGYIPQNEIESVYQALILGVHDYLKKCGFKKAVVGLSGGIDSAVTCCLAAAALGNENVLGISMPGPYSSRGSLIDSETLARNLDIEFLDVSISDIFNTYNETLRDIFTGKKSDITEENIQARIRGNILMALSNKFGYLVLSTGNKSEIAVGYCTLYGDMSGGLSVISDVPKTMVYELARFINRKVEIIPENIMTKAPSAELRPDQKDQDSLPPYDVLDSILERYIDEHLSEQEIIKKGFDPETVFWVISTVNKNEYKRRQAAPGLKVTTKAFGIGRRMPVAAKY